MELDTDKAYSVKGYSGIAFEYIGPGQRWDANFGLTIDTDGSEFYTNDGEWVDDQTLSTVRVCMIGDDRVFEVDRTSLTELSEDDYCGGCGQIGCGWC